MNPHHDFNAMMGHGGGGMPPPPPGHPGQSMMPAGMMPPMPPMSGHMPMPPMPPMPGMMGNMPGMMPMMRMQASTPPLFIGHFSNAFQKPDHNNKHKTRPTIYSIHEVSFRVKVKVEGIHVVPLGFTPDGFKIRGRTKPDMNTRPFELKMYGRVATTKELIPLLLVSVSGGVEWMPLPAGLGDVELDFLAIDGDFDDLSIIIHGSALEELAGDILPPYPHVFDALPLPGDVARKALVKATTGEMLEQAWSKVVDQSLADRHITLDSVCLHAKLDNTDTHQRQIHETIAGMCINSEHTLLSISLLAELVEKIFSLESSNCVQLADFQQRCQQVENVSMALTNCWKSHKVSGYVVDNELGSVRDIIGEDGSITLCEHIVNTLRFVFTLQDSSSQASCYHALSTEDKFHVINTLGRVSLECTRLLLVNEFFARAFVDMKGDEVLLSLIMQQQQLPLPEALFVLVIQSVTELSGFPLSLANGILPTTSSNSVEPNNAYQSLLYTMAGLKSHSPLAVICGQLVNLWTFIAQLRSLRGSLQHVLVTDMKQIAQAIHELYATNENIPSGDVTESADASNRQAQAEISSASYEACEKIFACYDTLFQQVVSLQQSWQRCQQIHTELDNKELLTKSWEMAMVDMLHHEKYFSIVASLLSVRKMVVELTTMLDWVAHPRSHELHHVSASLSKMLAQLFTLVAKEKFITVLCEMNASTIQYLWVEFGLDQTEDSAQGSAIQSAMDLELLRYGDSAKYHLAQLWCRCYFMQSMQKFHHVGRSLLDLEDKTTEGDLFVMTVLIMNELVGQDHAKRTITQMTSLYFYPTLTQSCMEMIKRCFPHDNALSYDHSRLRFALLCQLRLLEDYLTQVGGEHLHPELANQLDVVLNRESHQADDATKAVIELILSTSFYAKLHVDQLLNTLMQIPVSNMLSVQQVASTMKGIQLLASEKQIHSSKSYRNKVVQIADILLSRGYHILHILQAKFLNALPPTTSFDVEFVSTEELELLEGSLSADRLSLDQCLLLQEQLAKLLLTVVEILQMLLTTYGATGGDHLTAVLVFVYFQINRFLPSPGDSLMSNSGIEEAIHGYSLYPAIAASLSNSLQSLNLLSMLSSESNENTVTSPYSLLLFLLTRTPSRDACVQLLFDLTPDRGLLVDDALLSEQSLLYNQHDGLSKCISNLDKDVLTKLKFNEIDQNVYAKWQQYFVQCEMNVDTWKLHSLFKHWHFKLDVSGPKHADLSLRESIKQCWLAAESQSSLEHSLTSLTTKIQVLNDSSMFGEVPVVLLQSLTIMYLKCLQHPKEAKGDIKISLEKFLSMLVQSVEGLSQGSLAATYQLVQKGLLHTLLLLVTHAEANLSLMNLQSCITIYKRLEQSRIAMIAHNVEVITLRTNIQKVLNYVAVQLIDIVPALSFKHQEATSYLQQAILSIHLLPKTVFWNKFVSGFTSVGQGFTVEFIAVKLWIACEESFQYLYELLDIKKQSSMFATVFDQMPFEEVDIENMILEAQGQFAVAITALKAILELVMWAYETRHITLSIMSKAMRTTLSDPKKVIIRFQRMYTMWTIAFATQISEESKANGFVENSKKDLFSSRNLQELYDARHALISTYLKWLVELTGRYARFHSAKEEKCINAISVPVIAAEKWQEVARLVDLRRPFHELADNMVRVEKACLEAFARSQCCQYEGLQYLDRKLPCNLHHKELMNVMHQDIKSQFFQSWNGIDSNVKSTIFKMRELLQTRIPTIPAVSKQDEGDEENKDNIKEDSVIEVFHKLKKQRIAKNILPEDEYEALNLKLFPVPNKVLKEPVMVPPPPPAAADLSSFLASVELPGSNQHMSEEANNDFNDAQNNGQDEENRPAVRLQGVPRANKNNASLGKYFQNSSNSFAGRKFDEDAKRSQGPPNGHNGNNQSQGRPDFRQRQNPPDRQPFNQNQSKDDNWSGNGQQNGNNFDNNRGNFQDRGPRPNSRFGGGRQDQRDNGSNPYQPQHHQPPPQGPPRPLSNLPPPMPSSFLPPPPLPPMMGLPPGFVPPPRPPMFGQLPPPPPPPHFPHK